jgi:hypothetical protein
MTKGFEEDFATIQLLLESKTKTGRTDAFILAYAKLEKQVRRIFTFIIYQYPAFSLSNYREIENTVASKNYLDFDNFIKGFDALYPTSFGSIVGHELYTLFINTDFPRINSYRNKIIHGQVTGNKLSAHDLEKEVNTIKDWCLRLSETMMAEISFDGFGDSIKKNRKRDLASIYRTAISTAQELDTFIEANMNMRRGRSSRA